MSSNIQSCFLRCFENPEKIINLPHKTPITIGRNETTGIKDAFVSRRHIECIADYDTETVKIKTLGRCHSGCNGYALMKDSQYTLNNGDLLEVLLGYHQYEIVFEKSINNTENNKDNTETESKEIKIPVFDPDSIKTELKQIKLPEFEPESIKTEFKKIKLPEFDPDKMEMESKKMKMSEFDPSDLPNLQYPDLQLIHPEMIIMVGYPGSGKSYFTKNFLLTNDFINVNFDTLGNWNECVKLAEESLLKNQSVVIDNANPDKETRQLFIDVAKKLNVQCRCFVMELSLQQVIHNNRFRELTDKSRTPIDAMILNMYEKNYQEPEISEGFSEILRIPFVAKFDNEEDEKLYKMSLLEN